jgi:hypothetical protein
VAAVHRTSTHKQYTEYRERRIGKFGLCPVFVSYTQAFAMQLRKKYGKTSVRVAQYKNNEQDMSQNKEYTIHNKQNSHIHYIQLIII